MAERSYTRDKVSPSRSHGRADDPKAFAIAVGEGVRRARQALGLTQAQLAEAARLSPNYVARLERGEMGPSLFVAHQLCRTLRIDVDELLPSASYGARPRRSLTG